MTYLAGENLTALAKSGHLVVERDGKRIETFESWDITLRMGREAFISTDDTKRSLGPGDSITLRPGEFGLLLTEERIELPPDVVGFISVKFGLKQQGLSNISGFHVDPGYVGYLLFSVYNAGSKDIMIQRQDKAFMMGLSQLDCTELRNKPGIERIESEHMMAVRGRRISVNQLDARLDRLEKDLEAWRKKARAWMKGALGFLGAVALALLSWALGKYL